MHFKIVKFDEEELNMINNLVTLLEPVKLAGGNALSS
jgi:hypothetical protein